MDLKETTPIQRLKQFVLWTKMQNICKTEYEFERKCNLSPKYITNNFNTGKGNIGTEMLGRIIRAFPQLNLAWLCTGEGNMLCTESDLNLDYKQAYEGAMMQVEALNRIIKAYSDDAESRIHKNIRGKEYFSDDKT